MEGTNNAIVYEVEYANDQKTILTEIETAILFCMDFKLSANVNIWLNGNMIGTMYIAPVKA